MLIFSLASCPALTRPVPSGYALAIALQNINTNRVSTFNESRHPCRPRENRMISSTNLPSHDDLKAMKQQKKVWIFAFYLINFILMSSSYYSYYDMVQNFSIRNRPRE